MFHLISTRNMGAMTFKHCVEKEIVLLLRLTVLYNTPVYKLQSALKCNSKYILREL